MGEILAAVEGGEFLRVVASAGVVKVWQTRKACVELAFGREGQDARIANEKVRVEKETVEFGSDEAERRSMERADGRRVAELFGQGHVPLWRVVSGLMPGMDVRELNPNERSARMAGLIRAVEKVVRYEWRAFERTVGGGQTADGGERQRENDESSDERNGERDPRVRWWDPMRVVCEQFGIAYSALSRMAREVCGLAASDVTDRIKAETLRSRMRADVKEWVLEIFQEERAKAESELCAASADELGDLLWSRVAKKRGRGRWSRAAWAVRFGYSSYTRFQRACLAEHGVSPVELERAVMEEVSGGLERLTARSSDGAILEQKGGSTNYEGRSTMGVGGMEGRVGKEGVTTGD